MTHEHVAFRDAHKRGAIQKRSSCPASATSAHNDRRGWYAERPQTRATVARVRNRRPRPRPAVGRLQRQYVTVQRRGAAPRRNRVRVLRGAFRVTSERSVSGKMPRKTKDLYSMDDDLKLVELIKTYPFLFDARHDLSKNQGARDNVWKAISDEMKRSGKS